MKKKHIICVIAICFSSALFSQGIYDSLYIGDFRDYKPFNTKIDIVNFNPDLLNAAVFFATNEIREKEKLPQLNHNNYLDKSATLHSNAMAKDNFFSHTNAKNKKYREPKNRANAVGIINPHIAENIIEGFILEYTANEDVYSGTSGNFYIDANYTIPLNARTYLELADDLLKQWMNSEGHRANILSKDAVELGCGSAFYRMKDFNDMPAVKVTQNFQWFIPVFIK